MSTEVTSLLRAWQAGDPDAADLLMPLVYEHLHALAHRYLRHERTSHTLRPTALVHEAYLKLADRHAAYADRVHFYAVAARAMRQILLDWARTTHRIKRGGHDVRLELEEHHAVDRTTPDAIIEIDRLLDRLQSFDERKAQVTELIFFGGMTYDETATLLGVTTVTIHRDLKFAKAWMRSQMLSSTSTSPVLPE